MHICPHHRLSCRSSPLPSSRIFQHQHLLESMNHSHCVTVQTRDVTQTFTDDSNVLLRESAGLAIGYRWHCFSLFVSTPDVALEGVQRPGESMLVTLLVVASFKQFCLARFSRKRVLFNAILSRNGATETWRRGHRAALFQEKSRRSMTPAQMNHAITQERSNE